jgi:hypothetical protein
MLYNYYSYKINTPNKTLLQIGQYSVLLHIQILLTMYFYSGYNYISCAMFNFEYFNGTISMLLIIEHAVWLHVLWTLGRPPYHSLFVSYLGVFVLTSAWIMEVVVPIEPDPFRHHVLYAIIFVAGCMINLFASLQLLPGNRQGVDASYKYLGGFIGLMGVLSSLTWFGIWLLRRLTDIKTDWRIESFLQITGYTTYLAAVGVVLHYCMELNK